jgi:antitoxin (DNA-binding transcriptional repressor) of toxin-antitoxin stability system
VHIVKIHDAKSNLSKLVKMAQAGERVVIANGDVPVVELVPTTLGKTQKGLGIGAWKGKGAIHPSFYEPMSAEELSLWEDGPIEPTA